MWTPPMHEEADLFTINAMDHVELWVGNAKQAVFYWKVWGFKPVAYSGLETGNRRYASYVLEQGKIRLVLSTPYSPHDEMAAHHLLHGDGVKVIAMEVDDVDAAYRNHRTAPKVYKPQRKPRTKAACYGQPAFRATGKRCLSL
jgi:4-hydroxyphenylpyruvate dioxygenase